MNLPALARASTASPASSASGRISAVNVHPQPPAAARSIRTAAAPTVNPASPDLAAIRSAPRTSGRAEGEREGDDGDQVSEAEMNSLSAVVFAYRTGVQAGQQCARLDVDVVRMPHQ